MHRLLSGDIEAIAQRVVRAYCKLPYLRGAPVQSIDPELLSTALLGLRIEYHKLSISGAILGLTARNKYLITVYDNGSTGEPCVLQKKTVFIDQYLYDNPDSVGRYHFTLAHEVSHQILWMLFPIRTPLGESVHCCVANPVTLTDEEHQANALASAILMPVQLVLRKMSQYGFGTEIKVLNRIYDPRGYARFGQMASDLGVSKTALCIRMKNLGLLQREYLKDPYSMFDIYPCDAEPFA